VARHLRDAVGLEAIALTSDLDKHQSARPLLERYGDAASFHAAQRVDEMMDQGDVEGAAAWRGILEAIRELGSVAPTSDAKFH